MHYKGLLILGLAMLSSTAIAKWQKINDVDYTWGPFKICNISLFTETGEYKPQERPIMLTLRYNKPVDGRDFAISVAKSWANLGIALSEQNVVIDRLRKILPDLKSGDALSYIALSDHGYFVLNDQVIEQEFNHEFNDAMLAIWLDPKVEFSHKLITKKIEGAAQAVHYSAEYREKVTSSSEDLVTQEQRQQNLPNGIPSGATSLTEQEEREDDEKPPAISEDAENDLHHSIDESAPQIVEPEQEIILDVDPMPDYQSPVS
ncbi:hypothetical protein [[Haemophilus] ducreyi]|uniref:hypothetical protein n=1 Tax=Haemophilus ducreyi TaxID=730 RepID=UPI00065647EF|nr:hypothetical protein [[Haemophilus] ducreyi]AKO45374.1 hypothetical protein RZ66_03680 [[Haemophilus] ducreyi]AKO46759.1 hypothetical protein RZ67_03565 [[Haemophilus] ducreyi]AKO48099.1 hypothetical protein RZ68_03560 [[Haemophilus] ducreyi]AKO49485.1 hypothetical protein RZ69_03595 [[Haemophilus] ducreyi]ANF61478.1 hypothetical protein A6037_01195 [[Haemophilus] ducreyi]